jgi:hypothetical protein
MVKRNFAFYHSMDSSKTARQHAARQIRSRGQECAGVTAPHGPMRRGEKPRWANGVELYAPWEHKVPCSVPIPSCFYGLTRGVKHFANEDCGEVGVGDPEKPLVSGRNWLVSQVTFKREKQEASRATRRQAFADIG